MSTIFGLFLMAWGLPIGVSAILAAPCLVSRDYRSFVRRQLIGDPRGT